MRVFLSPPGPPTSPPCESTTAPFPSLCHPRPKCRLCSLRQRGGRQPEAMPAGRRARVSCGRGTVSLRARVPAAVRASSAGAVPRRRALAETLG